VLNADNAHDRETVMRVVLRSAQVALAIALLSMAAFFAAPRLADAASYFSGTKLVGGGGHYGWDKATCPTGYRVTGGGFLASPGTAVYESRPDGTTGWSVRGGFTGEGNGGTPYLTAYAVCVR
jgi:hypothetical protein